MISTQSLNCVLIPAVNYFPSSIKRKVNILNSGTDEVLFDIEYLEKYIIT